MKTLQKYQCEVCHTEYARKKDAEDCEKSHKIPLSIAGARHLARAQNGTGYPVAITVHMSDGKDITYKR